MNAVLEEIVTTQQVTDGARRLPLRHPDFPASLVAVDPAEGAFLQEIVRSVQPRVSIEIGCAYGVSSLYICEALAGLPHRSRHIVVDPFQSTQWRGIGLRNLHQAGYLPFVDFREEYAEFVLPALARERTSIDFAFVDGWHTFDQVMMEFYFLNRLLRVGGVIAFDDANRRSVNRVIRHALTYPAYRACGTELGDARPASLLGRSRRVLGRIPAVTEVLRKDFLQKDWDLGILGSCVAIQKVGVDKRGSGWDRNF